MIALCLSLAVTAALPPRVALMTASRVNVGEAEAAQFNARFAAALKEAGLGVLEVSLPCQGDFACLQQQGRGIDVEAVVSITMASGPRQIAVDVETVSMQSATSIDQRGIGWKNKQPLASIGPLLRECAQSIAAKVLAARPVDAPRQVELFPPPAPAPALVVAGPVTQVSRVPELITGGAAIALGVAAAVLWAVAADQHRRLAAESPYTLTLEQATTRRNAANTSYTAAAVTGGVAGALAITSLTSFLVR